MTQEGRLAEYELDEASEMRPGSKDEERGILPEHDGWDDLHSSQDVDMRAEADSKGLRQVRNWDGLRQVTFQRLASGDCAYYTRTENIAIETL